MMFRKLDLFLSSGVLGGKTPTQLGPLDRANLNHWTLKERYILGPYRLYKQILKGSDNGVSHSELLGFWSRIEALVTLGNKFLCTCVKVVCRL
jgi:hypothetical protein